MMRELTDATEGADEDRAIAAVVVTGAGRGFCLGADIEATFDARLEGDESAATARRHRDWVELTRSVEPGVAAVNAVPVGTGLPRCSGARAHLLPQCYISPEHEEAVSAFLAKRQPNFR